MDKKESGNIYILTNPSFREEWVKIGIDLEVVGMEVSVGLYSADLLAKDNDTNNYVVIENQLEKTNHDHLGKSITYTSALNAKSIVWIATDFT